jgi:hypothetical protein
VAEWAVKGKKQSCKDCKRITAQSSFAKGIRIGKTKQFSCEDCPVLKAIPNRNNENIIELYSALPRNYDFNGARIITASDVEFVFKIYEIDELWWSTYYQKIMYFHEQVMQFNYEEMKKKEKQKQSSEDWKRKRLQSAGGQKTVKRQ